MAAGSAVAWTSSRASENIARVMTESPPTWDSGRQASQPVSGPTPRAVAVANAGVLDRGMGDDRSLGRTGGAGGRHHERVARLDRPPPVETPSLAVGLDDGTGSQGRDHRRRVGPGRPTIQGEHGIAAVPHRRHRVDELGTSVQVERHEVRHPPSVPRCAVTAPLRQLRLCSDSATRHTGRHRTPGSVHVVSAGTGGGPRPIELRAGPPAFVLALAAPFVGLLLVGYRAMSSGLSSGPDDPLPPWILAVVTVVAGVVIGWRAATQRALLDDEVLRCRNLLVTFELRWETIERLTTTRRFGITVIEIRMRGIHRRHRLGAATRFTGHEADAVRDVLTVHPGAGPLLTDDPVDRP